MNSLPKFSKPKATLLTLVARSAALGWPGLLRRLGVAGLSLILLLGWFAGADLRAQTSPPTSGLSLWLAGDTGVTLNGSNIATWADQSGNGNNATQSTAGNQPALTANGLNGKPIAHFAGSQYLALPNFLTGDTAAEILIVLRVTSSSNESGPWRFGSSGIGDCYSWSDGGLYDGFGSNTRYTEGTPPENLTQFHVCDICSQSGLWQNWINGALFYQSNSNTVAFSTAPLLGENSGGLYFLGDIAEILVYNHALSSSDQQSALSYLAQKWNLFPPPAAPTGLTVEAVTATENLVFWNWTTADEDVTYTLERKTGAGGTYAPIATLPGRASYLDPGVSSGTQYYYQVCATNAGGTGPYSEEAASNASAGSGFNLPTSGLALWLMADPLASSAVGDWQDFSGNGNDAIQNTGARQPTLSGDALNGLPVVHFTNSSDQDFSLPNFLSGSTAAEVVVITRATNTTSASGIWRFGSYGYGDYYSFVDGSLYEGFGSASRYSEGAPPTDITQFHVYDVCSQAGLWQNWMDGTLFYQSTSNTVGFNTAPLLGGNNDGNYFNGDIAEILVYNRALSTAERAAVLAYFSEKWNLFAPPPAPTGVTVETVNATDNLIFWNWQQADSALSYVVERATSASGTFTPIATVDGRGSYLDATVTSGTQYYYEVEATNIYGASAPSAEVATDVSAGAGFNLATSGMALWLMADVLPGSAVGDWQDFSGHASDAVQSTGSKQPIVTAAALNGLPVVHFTGSSAQDLTLPNFLSGSTAAEVLVVTRATNTTSASGIWRFGSYGSGDYYSFEDGMLYEGFGSASRYSEGSPAQDITQFHVYDVCSQAGLWQNWMDGALFYQSNANTVGFSTAPLLGGNNDGAFFDGDLAEVIIYNRALTASERQAALAYLGQKWALYSAPATPTDFSVVQSSPTQNVLTWNWLESGDQVTFIIERKTGAGGVYSQIGTVTDAGTYLDNGITSGQDYYYRILASDAGGASGFTADTGVNVPAVEAGALPTSGMSLWLMGDGVWDSPIGDWPDSSGNGWDATQSSATNRPTLTENALNGLPVVHFAATSSQSLNLPNILSGATAGEVFAVLRTAATTNYSGLWRFGTYGYGDFYSASDGTLYDGFGSTNRYFEGTPPQDITQFHIYEAASQAGLWENWIDGVPIFESPTNTVAFSTAPLLGANTNANYFTGDIAELIVYNRTLGAAERQATLAYLTQKYALESAPAVPTGLLARALTATTALVTWNSPVINSAVTFAVWRQENGGAWAQVATLEGERTFLDSGLDPAGSYVYMVSAMNAAGSSACTSPVALDRSFTGTDELPASGLSLWLMADGVWETPLGRWPDASGNGNDAVQLTSSTQPVLTADVLNGKPVVHFAGSEALDLPNLLAGSSAAEIVVVLRAGSAASNSGPWSFGNYAYGDWYSIAGTLYDGFGSSARYDEGVPAQDITQFHVYDATSQAGLWESWIDGVPLLRSATNTVAFTSTPLLGMNCNGGGFSGDMAEVLVYNRALTASERKALLAYLDQKYALIPVPSVPTGVRALALNPQTNLINWSPQIAGFQIDYQVWRQEGSGAWSVITTIPNSGTYLDTGLDPQGSYAYSIQAVDGAGASAASTPVTVEQNILAVGQFPLSGLSLWLSADGASESPVGYWEDESGLGNDAPAPLGNGPVVVANALNGMPVLHFNGTSGQFFNLPNLLNGATAGQAFVVLRTASATTASGLWSFGASGYGADYPWSDQQIYDDFGSTTRFSEGQPSQDLTQFHLYEAGAQAGLWQSWLDGNLFFQSASNTVGFSSTPLLGKAYGTYFSGDIAEIIVYNRPLSLTERMTVEQYLDLKYLLPDMDADGSGLTNAQDAALGTNPYNRDNNGNGLLDGIKVQLGLNPLTPDPLTTAPPGYGGGGGGGSSSSGPPTITLTDPPLGEL